MKWLVFLFLGVGSAHAEYRAYQLKVLNPQSGAEKTVVSTLDHLQYREYYHAGTSDQVFYLTSWMCYGNTGRFKAICPNPKAGTADSPTPEENLPSPPAP